MVSAEENNAECQYFPGGSPVSEKHGIPGRPGTHIRLEVSEDFPAVALKPGDDPLLRFLSERFTLWLDDFGSGNAGLMWDCPGCLNG